MLAYVYDCENKLVLKEMPKPEIKKDTAIMRVSACSICGTDFRTYMYGSKKITAPRTIGHEAVGTIVDAGVDVKGYGHGDRVAVAPAIGCGKCYMCINGHPNMCDD